MGFGHRFFFVEDGDRIVRIPATRFQRIHDGKETLPGYAGQRVRCAHVMVQLEGRLLTGWYREWYFLLPFDGTGKVDRDEELRGVGLVMEATPLALSFLEDNRDHKHSNVVQARGKFAKMQLDNEFRWTPGQQLRKHLLDLALGRQPRRR
ncbi:MAG: hypothetical protein HY815_24340 [Candidatus Riflebacteria bacterium]|nr:hypothetical protein [Candidatus Riflebacteria bacterium]